MASALMHDQWADSPPTFQSVYRFSILPQSQIKQDYYRGRRLGDVSRSSRRSLVDEDFVKTQNLLARGQYVAPKERNERRCRNKSRRRERTASDKEQSNTKVPTPTTKSSLASQSTLSDFHWHEVLRKVILFTIALLLCAPSTLQPIAEQDIHGSAAKTDSFEGIRYELVPDRRRWAVPPVVEQTAPASSPSVLLAGLDSDRSQEHKIAATVFELAETIVPIINFRKLLRLPPTSSDTTVTTIPSVSTEQTVVKQAWGSLTDSGTHSTPTESRRTSSEVGGVSPISPGSTMAVSSSVTIEEKVEQDQRYPDDPQTPFTVSPPKHADHPIAIETVEQARNSSDDPQTAFTPLATKHTDSPVPTEETVQQAPRSPDEPPTPFPPSPSPSPSPPKPVKSATSDSVVTVGPSREPYVAPPESPPPPPARRTSTSDVWHYCEQCSQWHG